MDNWRKDVEARDGETYGYNTRVASQAIKAFCRTCQGGERGAAKYCDKKECPLFIHRTGHKDKGAADEE